MSSTATRSNGNGESLRGVSVTRSYMQAFLGYAHEPEYAPEDGMAHLAEGGVDSRTGGAAVVHSIARLDPYGDAQDISVDYWRLRPDGHQDTQSLIQIDTLPDPRDSDKTLVTGVWINGRKVPLSEKGVARTFQAVKKINLALREGKLPPLRRIYDDCHLHDVAGEPLFIDGFISGDDLDFIYIGQKDERQGQPLPLTIPAPMVRPLMGIGINNLDPDKTFEGSRKLAAVDPQTGVQFGANIEIQRDEKLRLAGSISPLVIEAEGGAGARKSSHIEKLFDLIWQVDPNTGRATLIHALLVDEPVEVQDQLTTIRSIGTIAAMLRDSRQRRYPKALDHLIENDMHHRIWPLPRPPRLDKGGRFTVTSLGGNGEKEIVEGYGFDIGGNCKAVMHEGIGDNGKVDRCGALLDYGLFLQHKDSERSGAAPDPTGMLKDCDHIFLTHRHLDHLGGITVLASYGYLVGKTVHGAGAAIYGLRRKLEQDGVPKRLWPQTNNLEGKNNKGQGWIQEGNFIHVEKDGVRRLSVQFSPEGQAHTARGTPYRFFGRYGSIVKGSYLNAGDMRFERQILEEYKGKKPHTTWTDTAFFTAGMRGLAENDPSIAPQDVDRQDTLADFDCTSVRIDGTAPDEQEVEDNLTDLLSCFADKGVILGMISTSDNRFETVLRVGTRTQRDVTGYGANIETTATIFNQLGVNKHQLTPLVRNNLNHYLRHIAGDTSPESWIIPGISRELYRLEKEIDQDLFSDSDENADGALPPEWEIAGTRSLDVLDRNQAKIRFLLEHGRITPGSFGLDRHSFKRLLAMQPEIEKYFEIRNQLHSHARRDDPKTFDRLARAYRAKRRRLERYDFGTAFLLKHEGKFELLRQQENLRTDVLELTTEERAVFSKEAFNRRLPEIRKYFEANDFLMKGGVPAVTHSSRTSLRAKRLIENNKPRSLVYATGTQGTEAEEESAISKLADNQGLFRANPLDRHTAIPVGPNDYIIGFLQTPIPGNEDKRAHLVQKLRRQGYVVFEATHGGVKFHGLEDPAHETSYAAVTKLLADKGLMMKRNEADGSYHVDGFPIHAPGHGYREDVRQNIRLVDADVSQPQHTSDPLSVREFHELLKEEGRLSTGVMYNNFQVVEIDKHQQRDDTRVDVIGRLAPSMLLVRQVRKYHKYYDGHYEVEREISLAGAEGLRLDGLMGSGRDILRRAFPSRDIEQVNRMLDFTGRKPDAPADFDTVMPREKGRHRSRRLPPPPPGRVPMCQIYTG